MGKKIRVTVWYEFMHEKNDPAIAEKFPDGMHGFIRDFLKTDEDLEITTTTFYDNEQGLEQELLDRTDVLVWWSHMSNFQINPEYVERIRVRVHEHGMGMVCLHSAHFSQPFRTVVGTSGMLSWGDDQKEILWTVMPAHPIAAGIPEHIIIEKEEMYGEPFYIPQPDETVFMGWFENGNLFRSGCCFYRGLGKVFYFQPGHEYCRAYFQPEIQQIIRNGVHWAAPNDFGISTPTQCSYKKPVTDEFNK